MIALLICSMYCAYIEKNGRLIFVVTRMIPMCVLNLLSFTRYVSKVSY